MWILIVLAGFFLAIIAAGIGLYISLQRDSEWYCSPTTERRDDADRFAKMIKLAPPPPPPATPYDFSQIKLEKTTGTYTVQYPFAPHDLTSTVPDQIHVLDTTTNENEENIPGIIRVKALATAWITELPEDQKDSDYPYVRPEPVVFHPDGSPMDKDEGKKLMKRISSGMQPDHHEFIVVMDFENILEPKILGYGLYDAATKRALTGGYSWQSKVNNQSSYVNFNMRNWRTAPAWLRVDIAYGPPVVKELPMDNTKTVNFGDFQCQFVEMFAGNPNSWSSGGGSGGVKKATIQFKEEDNQTCILIYFSPEAERWKPTVEVLTTDGKVHDAGGNRVGDVMKSTTFYRVKLEDIKSIRIVHRPNVYRCMIPVISSPGMPEENSQVDNLFDVRVPYIRFKSKWEFDDIHNILLVANTSYKNINSPEIPDTEFPMEFHNVTVEELYRKYVSYYPDPVTLSVDEKDSRITISKPIPLKERIKEIMQKAMRAINP
ncbi:MAG: hypothetical protein ACLFQ6_11390 [Candidatus Sumerlaeia bacterium]